MAAVAAGTVGEAIRAAATALGAAGVDSPRLDAELLLAEALGVGRASLAAGPEAEIPAPAARSFGAMVRRRAAREPVAYILGRKGFRRIELEVDRRALIPRPESELLVELAVEIAPSSVLDVGTGSGAIALAIADEVAGCEVVATDTSPAAIALASDNAARLGLADRVRFELGTLPSARSFDLVVANLPYVRSDQWAALAPEIARFEPREALIGGRDGLVAIRSLIDALAASAAAPGPVTAVLALEVGAGQAPAVERLLRSAGFVEVEARADLAGIARVVVGRRKRRARRR